MKIVYIANTRIPTEKAHGWQICKMCEQFGISGITIELWLPWRENSIKENAFSFYGLEKKFNVKIIKGIDWLKLKKYFGKIVFYLQTLDFSIRLIFIKVEKNAIIYTRNPEIAWIFRLRGFKAVYECHDWFGKALKITLFFLKRANLIITTNSFIKKEFIKNGFEENRLLIAPNGVDIRAFDLGFDKMGAIKQLNLPDELKEKMKNGKMLLYAGSYRTMGVDKGLNEILEAIKILDDDEIYFFAVGGGSEDIEYYERMARLIGVEKRAFFLARLGRKDLALFQKASDILLMPFPVKAHYKYFMSPLKSFEYMASRRPIIASDLPSIREILNEDNCIFCVPGNPQSLADRIKFLIGNHEFGKNIADKAYSDVMRYTWEIRAKKIINALRKI